jgi:hypothetical protein
MFGNIGGWGKITPMIKRSWFVPFIIIAIILTGCSGSASPTPIPVVMDTPVPVLPTTAPSPTVIPPATRVLISTGNQLAEADVQGIVASVQSLAGQSGLSVDTVPNLTPELLTPDVKVAIVLPPDPGVTDLAGRFPDIRFISVAIPSIQPSANLFAVGVDGPHPEWSAFVAGYIAAIITNEWRAGALTQAGSNDGLLAGDAFRNGVMFFCGLCQKKFAPFDYAPPVMEMNPAAPQAEWQPIADSFIASAVKTAYIYPGVAIPDMMAYLAQNGMKLIGSQTPPDALRPAWVATIKVDYGSGLQSVWADVISGASGRVVPAGISVTDVDSNTLTDGKMRLVNEVISELTAGAISPNTVQ